MDSYFFCLGDRSFLLEFDFSRDCDKVPALIFIPGLSDVITTSDPPASLETAFLTTFFAFFFGIYLPIRYISANFYYFVG